MVAESFRDAGHRVVIAGARRDDLEVAAKELDVDAIVLDNTDPASLEQARGQFPHHLDAIVNVPAPRWHAGDPRTYSLADLAAAWRNTLDATAVSAVLTVQILGDHGFMQDYPVEKWMREARTLGLLCGGADAAREDAGAAIVADAESLALAGAGA
jgi:alkylation response protein AidB-like acyl-CoA dehydrogenase